MIREYLEAAGVPRRYLRSRLTDFNERRQQKIREIVSSPNGSGMWISGGYGAGKTHLLAAVCAEVFESTSRRSVEFADWATVFRNMRSRTDYGVAADRLLQRLQTRDVLFLDDFGKGGNPNAEMSALFELFNARYNQELATFISCNAGLAGTFGPIGDPHSGKTILRPDPAGALLDRMRETMHDLVLGTESRRRRIAA